MIRFERASFAYRSGAAAGETGEAGVHDVDLQVRPGEVVVLCGRSGCGKSTLLRLANGLAPRFFPGHGSGRVLLDGEEVGDLATWRIAERAGSLFQNPRTQFFNVDTTGEVAFALESAGWPEEDIRARVDSTLRELGLEHLAGRSIFELSGGSARRSPTRASGPCARPTCCWTSPRATWTRRPSRTSPPSSRTRRRRAARSWWPSTAWPGCPASPTPTSTSTAGASAES